VSSIVQASYEKKRHRDPKRASAAPDPHTRGCSVSARGLMPHPYTA
jgi:hypothetical protein